MLRMFYENKSILHSQISMLVMVREFGSKLRLPPERGVHNSSDASR